jgi:hypothetical protein
MTVEELIAELTKEDPASVVVMAKDSEGNSYSPLSDYWAGVYRADSTYSGDVGYGELTPELEKAGYGEDDIIEDGVPAVILCPTN